MRTFEEQQELRKKLDAVLAPLDVVRLPDLYRAMFGAELQVVKRDAPEPEVRSRRVWIGWQMRRLGWDKVQVGWVGTAPIHEYRRGGTAGGEEWHRMQIAKSVALVPAARLETVLMLVRMAERTDPKPTERFLAIKAALGAFNAEDSRIQEEG